MAEEDVELECVLAPGRAGLLEDPHPECREPQFGVAHEVEQLGDRGQGGGEGRHCRQAPFAGLDGEGGAVPQACLGHRAGLYRAGWAPGSGLTPTAAARIYRVTIYRIAL